MGMQLTLAMPIIILVPVAMSTIMWVPVTITSMLHGSTCPWTRRRMETVMIMAIVGTPITMSIIKTLIKTTTTIMIMIVELVEIEEVLKAAVEVKEVEIEEVVRKVPQTS